MADNKVELWLRMYEEQVRHGRHHETLRSQSTNMVVVISAALLAFVSSDATSSDQDSLIGVFMVVINLYGLILSLKHYERSRLHVGVAAKYRDVVSEASEIGGRKINEARTASKEFHPSRFPCLSKIRAYVLWLGLHLILAVIGLTVWFS